MSKNNTGLLKRMKTTGASATSGLPSGDAADHMVYVNFGLINDRGGAGSSPTT